MSDQTTNQSCGCGEGECGTTATRSRPAGATFQPGVDIIETAQEYTIRADVPGATASNVDVHFEEGVLTVHAGVAPRLQDPARHLIREYGVGDYERSFRIRADVDADKIAAEIKHGVLTIHLPKSDGAKPRKIAVAGTN